MLLMERKSRAVPDFGSGQKPAIFTKTARAKMWPDFGFWPDLQYGTYN